MNILVIEDAESSSLFKKWFGGTRLIHATITGVLLAFAVPFGDGSEKSPSFILRHILHKPVAFIILPLFALANTSLMLHGISSKAGCYAVPNCEELYSR